MALTTIRPEGLGFVNGRRNLIINGAMQVWQRGITIDSISGGGYLCDRWRNNFSGLDGNVDIDRSTDVPSGQGFFYSNKISMDASESSLDSSDYFQLQHRIEDQNLTQLVKGTSAAKAVTLSFWAKSSVASTYTCSLRDPGNSRQINKSYVISSANTWQQVELTFEGDTTGTLDNDNGIGLIVGFYLDAGSDRTSGTFSTVWSDSVLNTRVYDTTGWLESTSPEFYITGVQLELGINASDFEHQSYGDELARCQRYCFVQKHDGSDEPLMGGYWKTTTAAEGAFKYPVTMRATPTLSISTIGGLFALVPNSSWNACSAFNLDEAGTNGSKISFTVATNVHFSTNGRRDSVFAFRSSGQAVWDAEL